MMSMPIVVDSRFTITFYRLNKQDMNAKRDGLTVSFLLLHDEKASKFGYFIIPDTQGALFMILLAVFCLSFGVRDGVHVLQCIR